MRRPLLTLGIPLFSTMLLASAGSVARAGQQSQAPSAASYAPVPFAPGELSVYQARLGGVSVGSGTMEVLGVEMVHGKPTYHAALSISGGLPLARVNDRFDSWIDVQGLFSRRFRQDQKELRFERNRTYEFFPETRTYRRLDNGDTGSIPTSSPLDDVSFLFYARTLPLRVGETYNIPRYYKDSGTPVVIQVLRKQTISVPAGRFQTIVVRPIIKAKGLFAEGGEAEVFFSDDDRRIMVQMRSKVPVIGSLTLNLRSYRAGEARTAWSAPQ
ncbi:MAG: DUF3108 domain-containing protein [Gemmatimonadetes bacterium]|nr:DUF3108 domain-containing protein [Gemmatimonadota bacterium]